jgi:hypothetical protein
VAVKVFQLDLPPERMHVLVAELEALVATGLGHPAIATPLATGTDGTVAYLAEDYVPSDSLDVVMRDQRVTSAGDALRVAEHLAGALDFAAALEVQHGALHPRDVLVSRDDSIDDTRLTGLGVARAIEKAGVTPPVRRPYSAPERMTGEAWGRRADVFSLAALVHEMLWGRRLTATGEEAAGALTEVPGGDLAALRSAFARALAPKPADRFETAHEFAAALRKAFPGVGLIDSRVSLAGRQSTAEPRLPLDDPPLRSGLEGPVDGGATERLVDLKLRTMSDQGPGGLGELELRASETAQDQGRNVAPVTVPTAARTVQPQEIPLPRSESAGLRPAVGATALFGRDERDLAEGPPERPADRAALWPVSAALMVGIALGFGGGYVFGGRHAALSSAPAVTAPPATTAP